jgi:hypothetical protein
MEVAAAVLFGIAAAGGLVLATLHFQGKPLPMGLALVHGALAATGLTLFIASAVRSPSDLPPLQAWSLGLFIVAALGGLTLFSFHLRGRLLPSALVVVHGLAAATAFVLLVWTLV